MTDYREQAIQDLDDFLDARDKKKSTYSSAMWEYAVFQREARLMLEDEIGKLINGFSFATCDQLRAALEAVKEKK